MYGEMGLVLDFVRFLIHHLTPLSPVSTCKSALGQEPRCPVSLTMLMLAKIAHNVYPNLDQ